MKTISPEGKQEIIRLYSSKECNSMAKIGDRYGINWRDVRSILNDNGIQSRSNSESKTQISNEIIESLKADYTSGFTSYDLAEKYGFSRSRISTLLKKNGVIKISPRRKFKLNEEYFKNIDCEKKAYLLGLLMADGSISKHDHICLCLHKDDIELLDFMKCELRYSGDIKTLSKNRPQYKRLTVWSKIITKDLSRLGCVNNKTFKVKFPTNDQVPENLLNHFVRGYYDGDGSISKQSAVNICGTQNFCISLANHIADVLKIDNVKINPHDNVFYFTVGVHYSAHDFLEWLYNDATIYLNRKYERYIDLKKKKSIFEHRRHLDLLYKNPSGIIECRNSGMSFDSIAVKYGTTAPTIAAILK